VEQASSEPESSENTEGRSASSASEPSPSRPDRPEVSLQMGTSASALEGFAQVSADDTTVNQSCRTPTCTALANERPAPIPIPDVEADSEDNDGYEFQVCSDLLHVHMQAALRMAAIFFESVGLISWVSGARA
jgi:hypothetical protein